MVRAKPKPAVIEFEKNKRKEQGAKHARSAEYRVAKSLH